MRKITATISFLIIMSSFASANEMNKTSATITVPSKQQAFDRMPASTGEEISALSNESGKWHVAQVVEQNDRDPQRRQNVSPQQQDRAYTCQALSGAREGTVLNEHALRWRE